MPPSSSSLRNRAISSAPSRTRSKHFSFSLVTYEVDRRLRVREVHAGEFFAGRRTDALVQPFDQILGRRNDGHEAVQAQLEVFPADEHSQDHQAPGMDAAGQG